MTLKQTLNHYIKELKAELAQAKKNKRWTDCDRTEYMIHYLEKIIRMESD